MRCWMRVALSVAAVVFCGVSASECQQTGPIQPRPVREDLSLAEIHVHDPWILADQASHTYYLYTASYAHAGNEWRGGVSAYKSTDLKRWSGPYEVFAVPEGGWANPADGLWAPEVHLYRGHYYLFATLHNNAKEIPAEGSKPGNAALGTQIEVRYGGRGQHLRGTQIFVGDSPAGPFKAMEDRPAAPVDYMSLDGTLYVEDGVPYMVYAHEWVQLVDGNMEAVELKPDLSAAVGEPFYLFKASDAPWLGERRKTVNQPQNYVTDGPELYRTRGGRLLMIWSSFREGKYVETVAHSESGKLRGPWRQDGILVGNDSGHGMIFHAFDGRLMLVVHHPNNGRVSRPELYELEETETGLRAKNAAGEER
jgi:hypothetical protein